MRNIPIPAWLPIVCGLLFSLLAPVSATLAAPAADAGRRSPAGQQSGQQPTWTDLADLALAADTVLTGTIRRSDRIARRNATDVPAGQLRALVEIDLQAALKAPGLLPARAAWLWQGPAVGRNQLPFARGERVIVFARRLDGGQVPEVQPLALVSIHGQQGWSAEMEAAVRAILADSLRSGTGARLVTGIADATHVAGTVEGASESQFFLETEAGQPMALLVEQAPGQPPAVRASAGDLVDRATPVVRHTLLWRALACGLPEQLPDGLAADPALATDYALARQTIGRCDRAF